MRIIAGAWRGRQLATPDGESTRPTADRVRQALFDRLAHADWAGPGTLDGAAVLDAFAGTGALGLEALSRGAATATFIENDPAALRALRRNVAAGEGRGHVLAGDVRRPPPRPSTTPPSTLVFLDPPYGAGLLDPALAALDRAGWLAPGALLVAELGRADDLPIAAPPAALLADWSHGAARMIAWRTG